MITVPQVGKHLANTKGLNITSVHNMIVGAKIRDLYAAATGERPLTPLRTKTSGSGSHCLAVYPFHWWTTIEEQFLLLMIEEGSQLCFDFPDQPAMSPAP